MSDIAQRLEILKRQISEAEKTKMRAEAAKEEAQSKIAGIKSKILSEFNVSTAKEAKDLLLKMNTDLEVLLTDAESKLEGLNG
jgi:hypothetical protein